jgi:hypothetical protein
MKRVWFYVILIGLAFDFKAIAQDFSPAKNISNTSGNAFSSHIATDSSGNMFVIWSDNTPGRPQIFFSRSTDGGKTFSRARNISNTARDSYAGDIATDLFGNLFVVWAEGPFLQRQIVLARSTDGGDSFSSGMNISNSPMGTYAPSLVTDPSGIVFVTWTDGPLFREQIFFSRSTDHGETFSRGRNISNTDRAFFSSIAIDPLGNLFVV